MLTVSELHSPQYQRHPPPPPKKASSESVPKELTTRARCSSPGEAALGPWGLGSDICNGGGAWVRWGSSKRQGLLMLHLGCLEGSASFILRIHLLAKIGQGRRCGHWQPTVGQQGGEARFWGRHAEGHRPGFIQVCVQRVSRKTTPPLQIDLPN